MTFKTGTSGGVLGDFQEAGIRQIHDAFDARQLSPTELAQEVLRAMRASELNACLTVNEDGLLASAREAEKTLEREGGKVPRGRLPLLGIPLGIKDNLVTAGVRTTCASKILDNYVPPYTATCVERLVSAGAGIAAKLNMDEFAMGGSNENSAYGAVKHPTHSDRVPGGSSGGSAAAVRAGLCVAALGSDTGGSIRLPASYCGTVGFKPTYGRISRYGLVAFASSLDQVGPLARSVEDAALLYEVMSGHDPRDSTSGRAPRDGATQLLSQSLDWSGVRVGAPEEWLKEGLAPDVAARTQESLRWMEEQGAKLVPVQLPHAKHSVAIYYVVAVSEASSNLARFDGVRFGARPPQTDESSLTAFYKHTRSLFGAEVKRRIILGTFALSAGYADAYYKRAAQVRRLVASDFQKAFEQVDVIAGPVAPTTAYRRGEKSSDPLQMYLNDLYTIPANLAGLPAISVPCGEDSEGLSVGLQLMAASQGDARLLRIAHAFERERGRA